jgi:hypothetical protein
VKKLIFFLLLLSEKTSYGQNITSGKKIVDTLASPYFWGRGYTNDGMRKAALFLTNRFAAMGLQPLKGKKFEQSFSYPVNIFPGEMRLSINDKQLTPGVDFIVSPDSRGLNANGKLIQQDSTKFLNTSSRFIVSLENKLTWSVAPSAEDYTMVNIEKSIQRVAQSFYGEY